MSTIGIIGCGARVRGVAKRTVKNDGRLKVVAISDPDEGSLETGLETFGNDIKVYDDYRELVKDPEIQWVMVGSYNCFHRDHAIAALEAGKDVFCEKPLATNMADCLAMKEAWLKSGKRFAIGFTLRYSPHYRKIRELVQSGAIGDIISMEFNETLDFNHGGFIHQDWRRLTSQAGTHLLEKCCHDIDIANWIVGDIAKRVASFGGLDFFTPENENHLQRVGEDKDGNPPFVSHWRKTKVNPFTTDKDIIDNQVAILEYAGNVRATFHTNCNTAMRERRMYICGTEGTIRADLYREEIEVQKIGWDTKREIISTAAGKDGHMGSDKILCEELCSYMTSDATPVTGLDDGLLSAVTCFGMDESMMTGKVVDMLPLWEKAGIEIVPQKSTCPCA